MLLVSWWPAEGDTASQKTSHSQQLVLLYTEIMRCDGLPLQRGTFNHDKTLKRGRYSWLTRKSCIVCLSLLQDLQLKSLRIQSELRAHILLHHSWAQTVFFKTGVAFLLHGHQSVWCSTTVVVEVAVVGLSSVWSRHSAEQNQTCCPSGSRLCSCNKVCIIEDNHTCRELWCVCVCVRGQITQQRQVCVCHWAGTVCFRKWTFVHE